MLSFWNTTYQTIFGGESEGVVVKNNSVIELNLEDIQNDYAGNLLTHL
jgi:protease-4